jgi:hypothetical protein
VDGPTITVTKKTSVVQLNDVPTIIDNNQRELFDRLPGIVLAEQQNPTELNLSYRGLLEPASDRNIYAGAAYDFWCERPILRHLPAQDRREHVSIDVSSGNDGAHLCLAVPPR